MLLESDTVNRTMKMKRVRTLRQCKSRVVVGYTLALALCWSGLTTSDTVSAQTASPPNYVSFQGTLYLASDPTTPVTGSRDIEFRLYANENDLTDDAVWGERHENVQVFNGIFNVYLGSGEALPDVSHAPLAEVFESSGLWLGVKVGLDEEMAQRQKVTPVPYALTAATVTTAKHGAPPGAVVMYGGLTAPEGWLLCDGTAYSKVDYPALYTALGSAWGETIDTFNVPDFRGTILVGSGFGINDNTDTDHGDSARLTPHQTGDKIGAETHALTLGQIPPHNHSYIDQYGSRSEDNAVGAYDGADEYEWDDTNRTTGTTGQGTAHNNMQPTTYVQFIIKY